MKISKKKLKLLIENYLNEDETKEDNWLGKEELPDIKIDEKDNIKEMDLSANNALEEYKKISLKELARQVKKENKYIDINSVANAIYRTRHVFVEKIPGHAKDSHDRIGALGTIAIFKKDHQYIDTLKPVGELSKKNLKEALSRLSKVNENDVISAYKTIIPLAILNYSLLKTAYVDMKGRNESVEATVKHEFNHVKSYILNSVLREGQPRINIDVLRNVVRKDFKNMSEGEILKQLKKETTNKDGSFLIQANHLETIVNKMLPAYKDIFDDSYDIVPGQADEISARLHKLKQLPEVVSLIDNYHAKKTNYIPKRIMYDHKLVTEIKQVLPFIRKDLSGKDFRMILDDLAKINNNQNTSVPT